MTNDDFVLLGYEFASMGNPIPKQERALTFKG